MQENRALGSRNIIAYNINALWYSWSCSNIRIFVLCSCQQFLYTLRFRHDPIQKMKPPRLPRRDGFTRKITYIIFEELRGSRGIIADRRHRHVRLPVILKRGFKNFPGKVGRKEGKGERTPVLHAKVTRRLTTSPEEDGALFSSEQFRMMSQSLFPTLPNKCSSKIVSATLYLP